MTEPTKPETGDRSRKDAGKAAGFYLIPRRPLAELARLYAIGAAKYQPRGWEEGMDWSRVYDPLERHLAKWLMGERFDPVDGQHHLSSVVWACFALMEYELTHPELDDLHRPEVVGPPLDAIAKAHAEPESPVEPACPCEGDCIAEASSHPDELALCPYEAKPSVLQTAIRETGPWVDPSWESEAARWSPEGEVVGLGLTESERQSDPAWRHGAGVSDDE